MARRAAWRLRRLHHWVTSSRNASGRVSLTSRFRVTQEPHKHIHYASLLLALSRRPASVRSDDVDAQVGEKRKAEGDDDVDPTRDILNDLNRAFRNWVEGREWLNMRLAVSPSTSVQSERLTGAAAILLDPVPRWARDSNVPARAVQVSPDCPGRGRWRRRPC